MAAAGAGPRSAIASTSARNEPEIRIPRKSIVSSVAADGEDQQEQDELDRLPVRASDVATATTRREQQSIAM